MDGNLATALAVTVLGMGPFAFIGLAMRGDEPKLLDKRIFFVIPFCYGLAVVLMILYLWGQTVLGISMGTGFFVLNLLANWFLAPPPRKSFVVEGLLPVEKPIVLKLMAELGLTVAEGLPAPQTSFPPAKTITVGEIERRTGMLPVVASSPLSLEEWRSLSEAVRAHVSGEGIRRSSMFGNLLWGLAAIWVVGLGALAFVLFGP